MIRSLGAEMSAQASRTQLTRAKLLKAATNLFARKGFRGTSTQDIARRARVNEATVFRLFGSKRELYLNVLEGQLELAAANWQPPVLQTCQDADATFVSLADCLQKLFSPLFLRLLFFAVLERQDLVQKLVQTHFASFYEILGVRIQECVDFGTLRQLDPDLMGRAFVAMIVYHQISREFLGGHDFFKIDHPEVKKICTDIWLHGVLATAHSDRAVPISQEPLEAREAFTRDDLAAGSPHS